MSRFVGDVNDLIAAQLDGENITLAVLGEFDFITGYQGLDAINEYGIEAVPPDVQITLRATNASQNIYFQDKVYYGVGAMGSLEPIIEQNQIEANSIKVALSGVPSELAQLAFEDNYLGRPVKLYLAALDRNYNVINEPQLLFSGKMDNMSITHAQNSSVIEVFCTNKMAEWERLKGGRFNAEYQDKLMVKYRKLAALNNIAVPLGWRDRAFDFIPSLLDKEIKWGESTTGSGAAGSRDGSDGSRRHRSRY